MTPEASRRPVSRSTLYAAIVIAAVGGVFALIFGSIHTLIITAVLIVPVLLLAGVLYLVERAAQRAAG
ncbi:hypothetical protein [Agromyces sp. ZXT2-6]|uniref:hypothetical protein n=1 Tax=Agromyces sp. ZXT2-6 TaxID=3461153 RepID=UPI0040550379